jgi:glycosyltransferase involved in cell wall biosynthesis
MLPDAIAFVAPQGAAGGLAALEALACGTPVVAQAGTPAAEVITDGVTGIVVEGPASLDEAIAAATTLDRWACRHEACERFSVERRARDIEAAFVAANGLTPLDSSPATAQPGPAPAPGECHGHELT